MLISIAIIAILAIVMISALFIKQHTIIIRRLDNIEDHINEVIAKRLGEINFDNHRNKEKLRSLGELCLGTECSLATQVNKLDKKKQDKDQYAYTTEENE